jgi:hypothetical protein
MAGFDDYSLRTIQLLKKELHGRKVSAYLKPSLSAAQKLARVAFVVVAQKEPDGVLFFFLI